MSAGTSNSNGDNRGEKSSTNKPSPPIPIISNISRSISSSDREGRLNDGRGEQQSSDLTKALGELQVGSLPIHMTSPVKNRLMNSQRSILNHRNNNTNYYHSSHQQFIGSASLPAPNAPFLSSREGPTDKIRSMPEVVLPESALSQHNSIQYGSLRETSSSFQQYGSLRDRGGIGNYINANKEGGGEEVLSSNSQNNSNADERRKQGIDNNNNRTITPSLSSSLTALSILTRIKEPPDESSSMQQQKKKKNNIDDNGVDDDRPMMNDEPMEKEEEEDDGGGGEDANPDTFEAFDFEI